MGQQDKAKQIVNERYHFDQVASGSPSDIFAMSDRIADGVKGRMKGSFKKKTSRSSGSSEVVVYQLMGPGGLVSIATITLTATPLETGTKVRCRLDDFLFQKGSLGMKPTINGASQLDKFVSALKTELNVKGQKR